MKLAKIVYDIGHVNLEDSKPQRQRQIYGSNLCGKSQNTPPLAAVMNGNRGFGGEAPIKFFR